MDFFVHLVVPKDKDVKKLQKLADVDGLYGNSIVVEKCSYNRLPYANNTVDVVIVGNLSQDELKELSLSEIERVLRPRGKAIVFSMNNKLTVKRLKEMMLSAEIGEFSVDKGILGNVAMITKPPLDGADNWSHWEHGPDNNPVSNDEVIKAPYMTQWLGLPYNIGMPSITTAAGGRTFCAMGHIAHHTREEGWVNTLYARNGYNGTELWRMKLPDGYLAHRSAFVATDDTFYMIDLDGEGCRLLDPATGEEKGEIIVPGVEGQWKWMAIQDNILYVLAGEKKDPMETKIVRSDNTHWSWYELSDGFL